MTPKHSHPPERPSPESLTQAAAAEHTAAAAAISTVVEAGNADTAGESADPVLIAERKHLAKARESLAGMRVETQALDPASVAVGEWAVTAQLGQWGMGRLRAERLASLADDPLVPPFFGRTDGAGGVLHIGRRHIRDPAAEPLVVDWRAPVSVGFYRATAAEPMGVRRRRRFGFHAGALSSFEDEDIAAGQGKGSVLLAAEIERPRVGPMRDIVATIAPDQDEMVREALGDDLCIQGAPGTGKTAVGLHRAAYLLYTYPEKLRRAGVLIVGPNRAFLGYVAAVLPALGEIDVCQVTVDELVERVPITAQDSPAAALVKADARMAGVLRRAVYCGTTGPTGPLTITLGARRYRVPEPRLRRYLEELRRGEVRYSAARSRLPTRIAADLRRQREDDGGTLTEREATRLARSRDVRDAVDGLWPAVAPETVLHRLFCDPEFLARCARDDLTETEQHALVWTRPARTAKTARWSRADAVLLDEIADLLERTHQVGHVVIDEAQDLSPMQARAIGRRAETGSITVLGDLAQGTTPWAATAWTDVLVPLGKPAATITELSLAYRVPEEILKLANRLLPTIGPALAPARSVRRGEPDAVQIRTSDEPIAAILIATEELLRRDGSIGIIVPEPQTSAVSAALAAAGIEHLDLDANVEQTEPRVTVVPATVVNGLEFDHVVLLEPAQIAAGPRGLNRLYVALTRAVSQLIVVHAEPLPIALIAA